jgi:mono/diheme cytochrome c family protein
MIRYGHCVSRSRRWVVVAVGLLAVTLAACSPGAEDAGGDAQGPGLSTEARGAQLYVANCAVCHGSELEGTEAGPPLLSRIYEPGHHPDESFRAAITRGVVPHHWDFGAMPPVPGLDDQEIDAIIAYVRSVQHREGFIDGP